MTTRKPWNYHSAVTCCPTCDGAGEVASMRLASVNDPYPTDRCDHCDGVAQDPECSVCGFDQVVSGYDCFVCDTIATLFEADLKAFDPDKFAAAIKVAHAAALADTIRRDA